MTYTALYGNGDAKLRGKDGKALVGYCVHNAVQDQTSWVDFNGDGKVDFICDNVAGGHDVHFSRGTYVSGVGDVGVNTRVVNEGWCVRQNGRIDTTSWSDLNNDGKVDIICNNVDGGRDYLLSTGTGMRPAYAQEINSLNFSYTIGQPASLPDDEVSGLDANVVCSKSNPVIHQIRLVDFDGDGKKDLVCDATDGSHYVYLYKDTAPTCSNFSLISSSSSCTALDFTNKVSDAQDAAANLKIKLYALPTCGSITSANGNAAVSVQSYSISELLYKACSTNTATIQDTISYSVIDTGSLESSKCSIDLQINERCYSDHYYPGPTCNTSTLEYPTALIATTLEYSTALIAFSALTLFFD